MTCRTLFLTAMFSTAPLLSASVIYQTGFETTDSPAYVTGPLAPQNGWCCSPVGTVENTTVFAGSQAVQFDASGTSGQNIDNEGLTYTAVGNPEDVVIMDTEFMQSVTGSSSLWDVFASFGTPGFLTQLFVSDGVANLDGIGAVPVGRGAWNDYRLVLDFSSQTATGLVNGQFIASEPFQSAATGLSPIQGVAFGINSSPGTDSGFWDNLSIVSTTAPEPSSLTLLLAGLGAAGAAIAKRRKLRNAGDSGPEVNRA